MTFSINKAGLAMAASTLALCLASASPAMASQLGPIGGGCEGQEGGCGGGPHDPPPLPHTPSPALGSDGNSTIYVGDNYVTTHASGPGPVTVSRSSGSGSIVMSTSVSPIASVTGQAINTDPDHRVSGDLALAYTVILTAGSQQAADGLTAWIAAGHEIGSLHGTYSTDFTGLGQAQSVLHTGFDTPGITDHAFGSLCGGGVADPCGAGGFNLAMDFVPGAGTYIDAGPLDFYSKVFMAIHVQAGPTGLGHGLGTASAYIDPFISFDLTGSGLDPNDFSLTLGDGSVANAAADGFTGGGGTVPEPASWALMITGFGLAGAMLRRRRTAFA